jgi:hypothetical protein
MEPDGSLPCSQQPATGPYPEPDASTPHLTTLFPKIHSNVILPFTLVSLFPSGFPTKILYALLMVAYPCRDVKLTTHLHVVQMLRMRGAIPPLPKCLHGVVLS